MMGENNWRILHFLWIFIANSIFKERITIAWRKLKLGGRYKNCVGLSTARIIKCLSLVTSNQDNNNLNLNFFFFAGRWCRREWSSPPDTRANDPSRRVLYSSVFLGSPGKCKHFTFNFIDYTHDDGEILYAPPFTWVRAARHRRASRFQFTSITFIKTNY